MWKLCIVYGDVLWYTDKKSRSDALRRDKQEACVAHRGILVRFFDKILKNVCYWSLKILLYRYMQVCKNFPKFEIKLISRGFYIGIDFYKG